MGKQWKQWKILCCWAPKSLGTVTAAMKLKDACSLKKSYDNFAAAAKLLQSCPTLHDPIDGSPPGSPVPGILQARTPEWVAISFSNAWKWKVKVKSLSHVQLFATPWTTAYQAPPSMGFSRQEYWGGVPSPSPMTTLDSILKSRHYFASKGPYSQSYGFSSSLVQMWELDNKKSWVPKNWCFQTVVLEKTLKTSLDWKEIKPVNPKGNQPWIITGRTDAEAERSCNTLATWCKEPTQWKRPWS